MYVEQMRKQIEEAYSGPAWRMRVRGMDRKQVIAVYKSMKEDGRFDRLKKERKQREKMKEEGVQLNIWDFIDPDNQGKDIRNE